MPFSGLDLYDQAVNSPVNDYYERGMPAPSPDQVDPATAVPVQAQDPRNLIVRGRGPDIPQGMISVNGELERSQAAPQALPWWIRQYDEYKAQRQAEDDAYRMLQRIQSDLPPGAGAASGQKARQLQAEMEYQADVRRGVPAHEALARHGVGMFGERAPRAAVSAVRLGQPAQITPYEQERLTLSREQLAQSKAMHQATRDESSKRMESTSKRQGDTSKYQAAQKLAELAEKELERDPRLAKRDPVRFKKLTDRIEQSASILEQMTSGGAVAPSGGGRVALANKIAAANPTWTKAQVIEAVRKQSP